MSRRINLHICFLLAIGFVAFLIKWTIIYKVNYVGHADASGYAEMADSLIRGRGFEVDYISWYFLKYDPKIVRPEDHWPPLYSITIAPFFLIFGKTAFAAKLPSLFISCFFLPLTLYSIAKELSKSKYAGLVSGVGSILYPVFFRDSLYCLSDIIFTFAISATVLYAIKALNNGKYFYHFGIFMGLAYYAKGSGLVPIPGYILFFIIAKKSFMKPFKDKRFLASFIIAFLILLPWFVRNYVHFRDPLFSTQRFSAGYIGYETWEEGTYSLYWGERPPPKYSDKFKEKLLFDIKNEYQEELNDKKISDALKKDFKDKGFSLSKSASVSIKKRDNLWVITDNQRAYTTRKGDGGISVYQWGIYQVIRSTKEFLKKYFWWTIMDINSNWGKFGKEAFLTYFVNIPAILGLFLLWGNKKRHVIWITASSLIFFLSAGWEPIYRMALPMLAIVMPLGWATYFRIIELIIKVLKKIPTKWAFGKASSYISSGKNNLLRKINVFLNSISKCVLIIRQRFSIGLLSGLILCILASPVMIKSTESVSNAIKKSGYPYRDTDVEWMDMGLWLARNASPDTITMTRNPWELHFYSEQLAIQIPRTTLEKTIEVMRYYKPTYIIPQLDIRPSLKPLVEGKIPGLELVYDNKKLKLYKIRYDLLPE